MYRLAALLALQLPLTTAGACETLPADLARALTESVVIARVDQCHPDVLVARRQLAAARADIMTARQRPNPQLTLGAGSLSRELGSGTSWNKTFDHQVRIDQLIERGDKAQLRAATATSTAEANRADVAESIRQARASALHTFYDLHAAHRRQATLQETLALSDASLRALDRRVAAGDAAPLDAVRLRLDAVRLQADVEQARADVLALQLQLANQIDTRMNAAQLTPAPDAEPAPVPDGPFAPEQRPDVAAARARVASAASTKAIAVSQKTRDISVGVQYDHYPASLANPSGTGNTVSLSVSVPLFARHQYEGDIARASADADTSAEFLRRIRAAADTDIARAQAQHAAARERWRLLRDGLLPAAERVASGAELAYQRGATSMLDLLDARKALRTAQIELINATAEVAKAAADLNAATQSIDALLSPASRPPAPSP